MHIETRGVVRLGMTMGVAAFICIGFWAANSVRRRMPQSTSEQITVLDLSESRPSNRSKDAVPAAAPGADLSALPYNQERAAAWTDGRKSDPVPVSIGRSGGGGTQITDESGHIRPEYMVSAKLQHDGQIQYEPSAPEPRSSEKIDSQSSKFKVITPPNHTDHYAARQVVQPLPQ